MEEENKLVEKMIEFGYPKEISLRVIKKSRAKTIDEVLNWIEQSEQNGGDGGAATPPEYLNDEYGGKNPPHTTIRTTTTTTATTATTTLDKGEGKPKMTPEEAQRKALELQKKIREKKMMKEKEEEIQKEKNRIAMAKEMQRRKEQMEEFERKKYLQNLEKEKNEHKKEKEKQLELLRKEYEAKFGIAYQAQSEKKSIKDLTENEKREEIAILLNSLKNKHKDKKNELLSSLTILKTYFCNIRDNILEKKFQKIKKQNKVFLEKIKVYEEMLQVFLLVGFEDTGDFYEIKSFPNTYLIASAIKFIDLIMKNLN
ncbi:Uncharacterized protein PCOAH_00015890 [Plasmodium coatneyi]|uniref:UBA domain-containing protein n=1 Tax=Plasmodium coatneyi TaxID=208452 RepID=A0A1B1DXF6_9APIC|nr:Uncharacterized protein PCOAH_00015890 [Plasmodium coatneyi]ANQ07420.1 Uncharacterized protein PCOAH_00015890 [Plasmodium coatneyi]